MVRSYLWIASLLVLLVLAPVSVGWGLGSADLAVDVTVDDATPSPGATVVYTVALTNNGPDAATNVQVDDLLPTGVTFASSALTGGFYIGATGVWILSSIDAGTAESLTITAMVDAGSAGLTITNTAAVSFSDQSDGNSANDTDSVDIVVSSGAQFDTPGIGGVVEGRAKVAIVVGAAESGAPAGFTVQWMKYSDYVANGSQWPEEGDPLRAEADFYGVPTLNTWDGTLESFAIDPWQSAVVEIGDLFDETGVNTDNDNELSKGTTYVFRARANGDGITDPSPYSPTTILSTSQNTNCTYTQGYWKNHASAWPKSSATLGNVSYDQTQLLAIFHEPARGNGLGSLAHQLIAVELNIAQGAIYFDVETALNDAHALIGSLIVPPVGAGNIHPRDTSALIQILDDFNNGVIGPGHCSVSVENVSWGQVKAGYR